MDYKEGFGSLGFSHKSGNRVRWVILFPVLYEARPTTGGKNQTSYSVGDNPMVGGNAGSCRGPRKPSHVAVSRQCAGAKSFRLPYHKKENPQVSSGLLQIEHLLQNAFVREQYIGRSFHSFRQCDAPVGLNNQILFGVIQSVDAVYIFPLPSSTLSAILQHKFLHRSYELVSIIIVLGLLFE